MSEFIKEIRDVEKAIVDSERKLNPDIKAICNPKKYVFKVQYTERDKNHRGAHRI